MTSAQETCLVLIASESVAPSIFTMSLGVQAYAMFVDLTLSKTSVAAAAAPNFRTERRLGERLPVGQSSLLLLEFNSDVVICFLHSQ
jgi:hypothetical protein